MAIVWTRWLWPLVNVSRLSTASARLRTVSVNISRTSTNRWYASRVVYSGTANSSTAHHPAATYIRAISHATGARASMLR
jgi:hypothetical protein